MKRNQVNRIIPPFIGGIFITSLALIWELAEDTTHLEACEVYDLTFTHYLALFLGGTLVGTVIQLAVIEPIFKVISVHNKFHWLAVGLGLTLLAGTSLVLLTKPQAGDFQGLLISSIPPYFTALVFVAGVLFSSRNIIMRHSKPAVLSGR
jgi:hypothetical protein